ncbi:hypothetical protein, partial [Helicobacter sp. 12S02634-8]|uniref:beta strand repeat-containing protein n=1 Tax=Helicobacter sp. 12S02634-8 TaxID=1476199 RepID=UPI00117B21B2
MFPFSGDIAQADNFFGDQNCTLGSAVSCIGAKTDYHNVVLTHSKDTDTATFSLQLDWADNANLTANKMAVTAINVSNKDNAGSLVTKFKDSVWIGNFTNTDGGQYGWADFTFTGNYNGNTSSMSKYKGYAFVGDVTANRYAKFTFDNAKMKGNWTQTNIAGGTSTTLVFKNGSSLVGSDQTSNGTTTQKNSQIMVTDNTFNLTLIGSTAKADLKTQMSAWSNSPTANIALFNGSNYSGNITSSSYLNLSAIDSVFTGNLDHGKGLVGSSYSGTPKATINFKRSSFTGKITNKYNSLSEATIIDATFSGNGANTNGEQYALKGDIENQAGRVTFNFKDGAIWDGKYTAQQRTNNTSRVQAVFNFDNATQKDSNSNTISNNSTLLTINAKNNSKVGAVTLNGNTSNINFDTKSTLKGLTISGGTNNVVFKGGSSIGTNGLNVSGGTSTISFSDSSSVNGNINLTNGTSTLNIDAKNTSFKDIKAIGANTKFIANFDTTSVGALQATNSASSANFKNMAGLSIGKISGNGTDQTTNGYAGTLTGVLDFVPKANGTSGSEAKSLSISDIIIKDSNNNVHLTLNFGGADSDGKLKGKNSNTSISNIKGGGTNSSVVFSDVGSFDFSKAAPTNDGSENGDTTNANNGYKGQTLDLALKTATNIDVSSFTGALGLEKTSIILDTNSALAKSVTTSGSNDSSDSSDSSQAQTGILSDSTKNLSITFGNATIQKDSMGNVVYDSANRPMILANEGDKSFTLTQSDKTHTKKENSNTNGTTNGITEYTDGYVEGVSSDGNIGFDNDNFKKTIAFVYKDGTFKKGQSGYTGTILGGTTDSSYSFYNAGTIQYENLYRALGTLNLINTELNGIIGGSTKGEDSSLKPRDVAIAFDYSKRADGSNPSIGGLAIVGQGTHNISFDFTNNTGTTITTANNGDNNNNSASSYIGQTVKFAGSILGGDTTNPSKNNITIYNLGGMDNTKKSSNTQAGNTTEDSGNGGSEGESDKNTTTPYGILNALNNAGFIAINNKNPLDIEADKWKDKESSSGDTEQGVYKDDKKDIAKGSTIAIYGSSLTGNLKEDNYSLNLNFYSANEAAKVTGLNGLSHALEASSFNGNLIDLSKNPYDQTLTFVGKGSINASSNGNTNTNNEALVIKLSDTKL